MGADPADGRRAVVTQGEVRPGDKVLVTGAGSGVSTFAIQWAAQHGAEVWVSSGSAEKIEKAKALGAKGGGNYREPDCYKTLGKQAGGFDFCIDSAGGDAVNDILDSLRPGGRFIFFGATVGVPAKAADVERHRSSISQASLLIGTETLPRSSRVVLVNERGLSTGPSAASLTARRWEDVVAAHVVELRDKTVVDVELADGSALRLRGSYLLSGKPLASMSEEKQYAAYRALVEQVAPRPVTIRTFDLDEDDLEPGTDHRRGRTRRRGLRGLRLGLAQTDVLWTQLRALVRASAHGHLRIMFPFVTAVEEVRQARAMVEQVCTDLHAPRVPIGALIEVPAAALASDLLAPEVDFLTIGTNDLIQYTLAVDRTDDRVSDLYEPLHPAVLRLIRLVSRAARRRRLPVSLCGEMASDPALIGLLIGLGLREFSMTPGAIPLVRQVVRELHVEEVRQLAQQALSLATAAEVEQFLFDAISAIRTGEAG